MALRIAFPGQGEVDLLVAEAGLAADDGSADLYFLAMPFGVEVHEDAHSQAVLIRLEAAQLAGEPFGEHGVGAVGEVDRSAALQRLLVDDAVQFDVVADVGDVNPQPETV